MAKINFILYFQGVGEVSVRDVYFLFGPYVYALNNQILKENV